MKLLFLPIRPIKRPSSNRTLSLTDKFFLPRMFTMSSGVKTKTPKSVFSIIETNDSIVVSDKSKTP